MSKELRRVPDRWEHPKGGNGRYTPLREDLFSRMPPRTLPNYQMYEISDGRGVPISPVFPTAEALAYWMANHDDFEVSGGATFGQWLRMIQCGGAAPRLTCGPSRRVCSTATPSFA